MEVFNINYVLYKQNWNDGHWTVSLCNIVISEVASRSDRQVLSDSDCGLVWLRALYWAA